MSIYQVLLVHGGPITKLVLSLPWLESCSEIDQILIFLWRAGVQEFTLHLLKGKHYQLHSSLFSFAQLTLMNLYACVFMPPPLYFQGFRKLVQLSLHEVIIHDETLATLIAQSPMLEHLTIISSATLCLNVVAPNLKCLQFTAHSDLVHSFHAPLLLNASFLLKVFRNVEAFEVEWISDFQIILSSSPFIENLALDYYYLKSLVAGGISPDLNLIYLQVLKLSAICFGMTNEVTCAMLLITSCLNLQKITFEAFPSKEGLTIHDVEFFKELGCKDLSFCAVREVEMLNVSGLWTELEFIKMVLSKLLMLEKLVIEPNLKIIRDGGLKLSKEVAQFPHASPLTVIKFRDP